MPNKICPCCKGTKKQTIIAKVLDSNGWHNDPPVTMDCFVCGGTGMITEQKVKEMAAEKKMWCSCGAKHGSSYIPDNSHKGVISKHHYVCNDCGKITQIG